MLSICQTLANHKLYCVERFIAVCLIVLGIAKLNTSLTPNFLYPLLQLDALPYAGRFAVWGLGGCDMLYLGMTDHS